MYEAAILISRYFFVFYMVYFLWCCGKIVLAQRGIWETDIPLCYSKQRIIIVFFHLTSMLIVGYRPEISRFSFFISLYAVIGLIFLIAGNIILSMIYRYSSKLLFNCVFFVIDIGFIMLLRLDHDLAKRQLIWIIAGFLVTALIPFGIKFLPRLDRLKYIYLGVGVALLISTLIFGSEEGGAQNWIKIGSFGFQPAEIVKLLFVFYLASAFSKPLKLKELIFPSAMAALFVLCLVFQTDLGSALIFFMSYLIMIYIATGNAFIFAFLLLCASVASLLANKLFSHVRVRVETWLNPWADIANKGYQITQSLFAIGTWGVLGSGLTKGYAKSIPVVERDFIFAAICEEFGIIFAIGLILVFTVIFFCGVKAALTNNNRFLSLVSSGLTGLLCFQSFLIIGGVTKLIPLTGVTLPFVSYGGTSMVICFIIVGIIQWIYGMNNKKEKEEFMKEVLNR